MFNPWYSPNPVIDRSYAPVVVYGTSWCAASQMVRRYLDRLGIPYVYRDLEDFVGHCYVDHIIHLKMTDLTGSG
jgi:hypothetical protein